jgi:hypothetical protein
MTDDYGRQVRKQLADAQADLSKAEQDIEDGNRETLKAYAQLRAANAEKERLAAGMPLICSDDRHEAKVRGLQDDAGRLARELAATNELLATAREEAAQRTVERDNALSSHRLQQQITGRFHARIAALPGEIAYRIRAELVCCELYGRVNDRQDLTFEQALASRDWHDLCYWGEAAARLAEGRSDGANSQSATSSSQIGSCPDSVECGHEAALGRAEARMAAIRTLHRPVDGQGLDDAGEYVDINPACSACGTADEWATPWPCGTIRAIDGPAEQPSAADAEWRQTVRIGREIEQAADGSS